MATPIFRDLGTFVTTIVNTVPVQQGGVLVPIVMGFGRDWFSVVSEPVVKGATVNDDTVNPITKALNRVGDTPSGTDYVIGVDVDIQGDEGGVEWLDNPLTQPTITSAVEIVTGGTFAVDQFYIVTALNSWGETIESTEVQVTITGATSSILLKWGLNTQATSYKVYRSDTTGGQGANSLVVETTNNQYLDINVALQTAPAPPVATTAFHKPAEGATFYVTYDYKKTVNDYKIQFITSYSAIQASFGGQTINTGTFTSPVWELNPIGLAASILFANNSPGIYVAQWNNITDSNLTNTLVSTSGQAAIRNANINALSLAEAKDCYYVLPLTTDQILIQDTYNHCVKMSDPSRGAFRRAFVGFASDVVIGDHSTSGSMRGIRYAYYSVGGDVLANRIAFNSNRTGTLTVTNDDGSSQELAITGEFISCIHAGRLSGMASITYPVNKKQVYGIDTIEVFSEEDRLTLQNDGLSVFTVVNESIITIARSVTAATGLIEYREPTTCQQIDVVGSDMATTLTSMYLNSGNAIITEDTPLLIANSCNVILNRNKQNGLISKYFPDKTKATQDTTTPTNINLEYSYKLVYPLLVINATQVISLT